MSTPHQLDLRQHKTLGQVLYRENLRLSLAVLGMAIISIFIVGLVTLRAYMIDNLNLAAQGVAYGVEAAVVFNDRDAVLEATTQMIGDRPVSKAYVFDRDGDELLRWLRPATDLGGGMETLLSGLLLAEPAEVPILHNGRAIGSVKLYASGRDLLAYLIISVICAVLCLIGSRLIATRLLHTAKQQIVEPLRHLAELASKARRERQFQHRAKPIEIFELNALGEDFNALLQELEIWEAQFSARNELLLHKATHDPLTGLANRAQFEARLASELTLANISGRRVALFFIDSDRFKLINDQMGHDVGDAVLCAIACRLRSTLRESDLVARIGGDEFAVVLSPLANSSQADRIAGAMLNSMFEPIELPGGETLKASISIGIAFFPDHASDATGLLRKADEAMYRSKRIQSGSYSVATDPELLLSGDE